MNTRQLGEYFMSIHDCTQVFSKLRMAKPSVSR